MKLEDYKKIVPKIEKIAVKGLDEQIKLAPKNRLEEIKINKNAEYRNASVMALLYPKAGVMYMTLILRTTYSGKHSGQVALPGGKQELIDKSHWHTALREVEEEIGVSIKDVSLLKELTPLYIPVSNFKVFPFLAEAKKEIEFELQEEEVADIIEIPLEYFIKETAIQNVIVNINKETETEAPAFVYGKHKIWGATAMMLSELKALFIDCLEL